jgi:methylglutaconyl-CoA hydratase
MKLFVTGERFTGQQAVDMGFAHRAVPADQLVAAVEEEIDMINQGGPIAVVECKKLVREVSKLGIADGFALTGEWSGRMFRSEEAAEGMAAFREKRKAAWIQDS